MKNKLFYILLTSILSHYTSAETSTFDSWDFVESPDEYTLWAEMAVKHSIVEAIKISQSTHEALGMNQLNQDQKKLVVIPLSIGALAAVAFAYNSAYNAIDSITHQQTLPKQAHTYLREYKDTISSFDNLAKRKRLQYVRARRALAQRNGFQFQETQELSKKLQSHIRSTGNTHVFSRFNKVLRGTGLTIIGAISVGAYLSIAGATSVIIFENEKEMQLVLEQFSNDIYEIAGILEVSEGMELAGAFEIESDTEGV